MPFCHRLTLRFLYILQKKSEYIWTVFILKITIGLNLIMQRILHRAYKKVLKAKVFIGIIQGSSAGVDATNTNPWEGMDLLSSTHYPTNR